MPSPDRSLAGPLSCARDTEFARGTLKTLPVSDDTDRDAVQRVLSGFESRAEVPTNLDETVVG
jgi:hypothetical protein